MCGSTTPPPGGEYLFVTYQSETARFNINGCSVQADIASPEGQVLLARAIRRFGPGIAPEPDPPPTVTPAAELSVADVLGPIAVIVFAGGVLLGVVGAFRRIRAGRD